MGSDWNGLLKGLISLQMDGSNENARDIFKTQRCEEINVYGDSERKR